MPSFQCLVPTFLKSKFLDPSQSLAALAECCEVMGLLSARDAQNVSWSPSSTAIDIGEMALSVAG